MGVVLYGYRDTPYMIHYPYWSTIRTLKVRISDTVSVVQIAEP